MYYMIKVKMWGASVMEPGGSSTQKQIPAIRPCKLAKCYKFLKATW
jgi:hypothetical protein